MGQRYFLILPLPVHGIYVSNKTSHFCLFQKKNFLQSRWEPAHLNTIATWLISLNAHTQLLFRYMHQQVHHFLWTSEDNCATQQTCLTAHTQSSTLTISITACSCGFCRIVRKKMYLLRGIVQHLTSEVSQLFREWGRDHRDENDD